MPKSRTGRQRRNDKQWTAILRRFEASGLDQSEFCRRDGLALSSFQRWRQRLGPLASAGFVELVPSAPADAPSSAWSLEVSLPNGASLRFRA